MNPGNSEAQLDYRQSDVDQALAEVFRAMCEEFKIHGRSGQIVLLTDMQATVSAMKGRA